MSEDLRSLIDDIINRADDNRARMGATALEQIRTMKAIMRRSEVVFGVYPTEHTAAGFQFMVIKGMSALDAARTTGAHPAWDAIPCRSLSEAEAIERVFGDMAREIWPPRTRRLRLAPPPFIPARQELQELP